jgi:uroporphyrinogen-III decarboxylase
MMKTAEELYRERAKRIDDVFNLRMPDRVPIEIAFGYFPARYCGISSSAAYYDYDRWLAACKKTVLDFGADISNVQAFFPGTVLELIDPKSMVWPGHGASPLQSHQYVEGEYMKPDEYEAFLSDQTDYMMRFYYPRVSGAMAAFGLLPPLSLPWPGHQGALSLAQALSTPEVAEAIERLQKAGREMRQWHPRLAAFADEIAKLGFPPFAGGMALAPFDAISDHLRGMRGSMIDMYRNPDRLLEAADQIYQKMVKAIPRAAPGGVNTIFIPLHRGADGFMSIKQFERFYWPTLKGLIQAIVDKGNFVVVIFEGDYTSKLEHLLELPKGKVFAHIDNTDIFRVKKILNNHMCISGNVPCSLLAAGTPGEVVRHCRKMIDGCAKDGGFIMSSRSPVDDARPENLKAMIDFTVQYGVYR